MAFSAYAMPTSIWEGGRRSATASLAQRKRVSEVVTHELAHMWFGNWVTMAWWDDLWLNEAFATWMAFKIVDAWNPGWRMWLEFDQGKASALQLDALRSTHPIHAEVKNPDDMTESFDVITIDLSDIAEVESPSELEARSLSAMYQFKRK